MPFTPIHTLIGAAMMSTAATHLLVLNGGILGVSGFAHRTVSSFGHTTRKLFRSRPPNTDLLPVKEASPDPDQLALLSIAGLVAGGAALGIFRDRLENELHAQLVDVYTSGDVDWAHTAGLAVAGLLVGLGSKLSNGCTSGHMLCGVSRLSPRSLVASGIFVPVGIITHLVLGALSPFTYVLAPERTVDTPSWLVVLLLQIPLLVYRYGAAFLKGFAGERSARRLVAFSTSFHFALGLTLSGMLRPSKILNFMNLTPTSFHNHTWDPSLLLVIAGGILPLLLIWQCCLGEHVRHPGSRPAFAHTWSVPALKLDWREGITARLVVGAVSFGVGWGMCGICPGPGAVMVGAGLGGEGWLDVWRRVGVWGCGFVVGGVVGGYV